MKKIFATIFVLCAAFSMQAALHLNYEKWEGDEKVITEVTANTTIIVTDYEYDEDLEEALMEIKGQLYSDESQKNYSYYHPPKHRHSGSVLRCRQLCSW